ncbi:MAG: SDR family oxidoreductase [Bradyrhizobiaceae bacterium]|nr:SDR family oxidoreductase [Bradyrhizobiaceae bacterium]
MQGIVAGKVAIVTGAGRGIGRAIAHLMAKEGARIVVADVGAGLDGSGADARPAQSVANEIKAAGGEAIASTLSITEPANADKIVGAALDAFGRVDILVNNAGILRDRFFHKMSVADWSEVIAVHLNGSFYMSAACARRFREQGSGAFVHMTSTSGLVGNQGQANYAAAKMGLVGLSRGIALDMARFGVRSNCVAPFAWSRMIEAIPAENELMKAEVERTRALKPEHIAPLVVYLASEQAKEVTGQIFGVRGNEVYLFSQPRPVRTLREPQGWTPQALAEAVRREAADALTPLEGTAEYFNWEPV